MDEIRIPAPLPIRGVHPLAGLPPILATLAAPGDRVTAQAVFVTGVAGICLAEAVSQWAHRRADRADAAGTSTIALRAVFLAVPAVALASGLVALLCSDLLAGAHSAGVAAGGRSLLASAALLLLPLRGTRLRGWWLQVLGWNPRRRPRRGLGQPERRGAGGRVEEGWPARR